MRLFATKPFLRFMKREGIDADQLRAAIERAEEGLVDADLGGGVIKQRIARRGEGRSGGYRTIIAFKRGERAVFVYGFAKSDQANISGLELRAFRKLAVLLLSYDDRQLQTTLHSGALMEVVWP
jgi:hypothetical protein